MYSILIILGKFNKMQRSHQHSWGRDYSWRVKNTEKDQIVTN